MTDVTWNPAGDDDTSFGPLTAHNVLGGRTAADAHPATAVSYDHTVSGLAGDTVQEAIDELATSGGAVASVNGQTGVVVLDAGDVGAVPTTRTVNGNALSTDVTLDAADVGAVPTARTITAGTGLTGGGDLSADRTLTVTYGATAGTAAEGNDARLTDARTPTAHAASHQDGGSDELALDGSQITSGTVAAARLGSGTASVSTVLHGDGVWRDSMAGFGSAVTAVGYWVMSGAFGRSTSAAPTSNRIMWAFIVLDEPIEIDQVGITHNSAATAGSVARLGMAAPGRLPGVITHDFGTVDLSTAPGFKALAVTPLLLDRGRHWFGVAVQGAGGPQLRSVEAHMGTPGDPGLFAPAVQTNPVSGAFTIGAAAINGSTFVSSMYSPVISIRRSA